MKLPKNLMAETGEPKVSGNYGGTVREELDAGWDAEANGR